MKCMKKLRNIFEEARTQDDFGNGRYVRNVFEQAKMNQALRLVESNIEDITSREILTITEDDIVVPEISKAIVKRTIGFC